MNSHADRSQKSKSLSVTGKAPSNQNNSESQAPFKDNRPEALVQRQFGEMVNSAPVQRQNNTTGLPDALKSGVENLSGYSLDDVKVHYNSNQPAQLQAHAYAQGSEIHVSPGQEKHLAHEAWHVVQQKQGRVRPTLQLKAGVNVNDEGGLEREADLMGAKAWVQRKQTESVDMHTNLHDSTQSVPSGRRAIVQRYGSVAIPEDKSDDPVLTPKQAIIEAGDDDYVVVARVITPTQRIPKDTTIKEGLFVSLTKMFGDTLHSDEHVSRPSAGAVEDYVAQKKTDPVKELIEFTTDLSKVGSFAKESNKAYTVYVRVQKKYLTQSQSAESGWMANQSAPYQIVKSEKDDVHAKVKGERMSADDLVKALTEEINAEFMLNIQKVGVVKAFADDSGARAKYLAIMREYLTAKSKE